MDSPNCKACPCDQLPSESKTDCSINETDRVFVCLYDLQGRKDAFPRIYVVDIDKLICSDGIIQKLLDIFALATLDRMHEGGCTSL